MRNLLGRLHARRLPELLRIAEAWGVPIAAESKGEIVAALYRAMSDPRAMRDVWDRLDPAERAMALALADAPDAAAVPTLAELADRLGVPEDTARETALRLYRAGMLAREGDDEPLPIGVAPRLLLPRELATTIRRVQDEMAAGDLTQAPLRVLIELLDDPELETAASIWGLRTVPGVTSRNDIATRLLRLVNDGARGERVARQRSRDAAAIWRIARAAAGPVPLAEAARAAGLADGAAASAARLRTALRELESALLVWHAYRPDGARWLFVPAEIRRPGEAPPVSLPPLERVAVAEAPLWRHPDALAWDLLTLLRIVADPRAPAWDAAAAPPGWLCRAVASRFWFGGQDGPPVGYLELLHALAMAEGVLAVDEAAKPPRVVPGPHGRDWRGLSFPAQTTRLRERWLRLPRWIEGEPADTVEVWGADWRGMRSRLLAGLADPEVGAASDGWVTLDSLAARLAARFPALLGPSFTAATARLGGEVGAGADEAEARAAALGDIVALELGGPFQWFGLTQVADPLGRARAFRVTPVGAALANRRSPPEERDPALAPLHVASSGEIALRAPSPRLVWALSAIAEPVDLGQKSHYRLTAASIAAALEMGSDADRIVAFLERESRQPLPPELSANLAAWARRHQRVHLRLAVIARLDSGTERGAVLAALREAGWSVSPLDADSVLITMTSAGSPPLDDAEALLAALRSVGLSPRWETPPAKGHASATEPLLAGREADPPAGA